MQSVCICMHIYVYIRHILIAWVRFLWSRPQTTSHMVLVQSEGDRHVNEIMREPKWSRVVANWFNQEAIDR